LRTLRQYWGKLFSSQEKPPESGDHLAAVPDDLERRLAAISSENQALSEDMQRMRTELSDARERLGSTENLVNVLGNTLESDRQNFLKTYQDMHHRFRKQDLRLNWTLMITGFTLLLGIMAATVLISGAQRNASLFTHMSEEVKALSLSMHSYLGLQQGRQQDQQQVAVPPASTGTGAMVNAEPANSSAAASRPVLPPKVTTSDAGPDVPVAGSEHQDDRRKGRKGVRKPTRDDAKAFFEENASVAGMIRLPSGVQYRVIKPGSGKSPTLSDKIVVAYVGTRLDGMVFDDTYSTGEPATFSMKELLPGWREVLLKMEEGSEFEMYVPPDLANKGGVRKRSMLGYDPSIYLIELLKVVSDDEAVSSVQ
jgi:FKBP-type peptidyl-prolyl cis-trans isomerase